MREPNIAALSFILARFPDRCGSCRPDLLRLLQLTQNRSDNMTLSSQQRSRRIAAAVTPWAASRANTDTISSFAFNPDLAVHQGDLSIVGTICLSSHHTPVLQATDMTDTDTAISWADAIGPEKEKPYFKSLRERIRQAREAGQTVYPSEHDTFSAFRLTPLDQVKVVILGQDPYHGPEQAHGLAFSVKPSVRIPPSLLNIYKELKQDIPGFVMPDHGYLEKWAQQGVLLLNTVLTVQAGQAHSHAAWGWETFTDEVIRALNEKREHLVFMLWGNHARKKGAFIDTNRHLVLTGVHPSPLSASRGFFGCQHFSKANEYLRQHGQTPIDWQV